jgi:hypothetical protein
VQLNFSRHVSVRVMPPFAKIGCAMVVMHDKLVRNKDDLDELLVFECSMCMLNNSAAIN